MIVTGAVYISKLLNITPTLQYLNMGGNNIGDEGMATISAALQYNKSLTTLWVARCGLSMEGIFEKCIRCSMIIIMVL